MKREPWTKRKWCSRCHSSWASRTHPYCPPCRRDYERDYREVRSLDSIREQCVERAQQMGRTWLRLPYGDRERILDGVLSELSKTERSRWERKFSLGDV